jgi:hypothetical protein
MALGIFLLLIFVLYLIDKHNLWRHAAKVAIWFVGISILGLGGLYGWRRHLDEEDALHQARMKPILDCEVRNAQFSASAEAECTKNPNVVLVPNETPITLDFSKAGQMFRALPPQRQKALLGKMTQEQKSQLYASLKAAPQPIAPTKSDQSESHLRWYKFQGLDGKWYEIQAASQ